MRQMVHISKNVKGLYLSETSLKQLKILKEDFPRQSLSAVSAEEPMSARCCTDDGAPKCLERSPTPDRPSTIPFEPIRENRERL